ncbi:uncharacterized protein LOC125536871 [Triticum urartu]|uniref:uncharacterized protein LOC125536871 n=1 Tax=Triticum urartu TaxID=4572 RepID=UPI0020437474|nr:uncharacterized protein LOC125536871 [Triticum urartu]
MTVPYRPVERFAISCGPEPAPVALQKGRCRLAGGVQLKLKRRRQVGPRSQPRAALGASTHSTSSSHFHVSPSHPYLHDWIWIQRFHRLPLSRHGLVQGFYRCRATKECVARKHVWSGGAATPRCSCHRLEQGNKKNHMQSLDLSMLAQIQKLD